MASEKEKGGGAGLKWLKRGAWIAAAAAIVGWLIYAWLPKPVEADLAQASRDRLEITVDEDGRTRVKDRYVVSTPLSGDVQRILLQEGDEVHAGDVVARVAPMAPPLLDARTRSETASRIAAAAAGKRQAEAAKARAKAALELAKSDAERQKALAASGAVSEVAAQRADVAERIAAEDAESAELGVQVAGHELAMARAAAARLEGAGKAGGADFLEVTSPVDGRVLRVLQKSAGVLQAGAPLLEIGDPKRLEVVVDVLTTDAVQITPGAKASIDRWGGEGLLAASVRRVEPSAFTRVSALGVEEQRVNVILDPDGEAERWGALGDAYRVDARIVIWAADDVVTVPASAVFRRDDAQAVFVVDGDVVHLRSLTVGKRNGVTVQVLEGLAPGDAVVLHPSDQIADGVHVKPRGT